MHILIVDDEDGIRRALERQLQSWGHTICWSATGAGALRLMRSEPIELVILDMMLGPGSMSGWDVAREKLLDHKIRGIPIIVISGLTTTEIQEGAAAPASAFSGTTLLLTKPWDTDELFKAIDLLGSKKPPV